MAAAEKVSRTALTEDLFSDISVMRRKWQAALKPGKALPFFEDVMLGSLGQISEHTMLIKSDSGRSEIMRAGRQIEAWLKTEVHNTPLDVVSPDCSLMLEEAVVAALCSDMPYLTTAHCVRDGYVHAHDILALPLTLRWGGFVVGVYAKERGSRYNLLDAVFAGTDDGILSLAALRDARGEPVDFQIVHLNGGAAKLLNAHPDELRWSRLSKGCHALCSSLELERLITVVCSGKSVQFETSFEAATLKLNASPVGDLVSVSITDVTDLKNREQSFRLLFDSNPMPMWVFDIKTKRFLSVNDAAIASYGYDRDTFLKMSLFEIWPSEERHEHAGALEQIGDVFQSTRNWRHVKADGSEIEVLTFGRRVSFSGRDSFLVSAIDITERRKAEAHIAFMAHHDALTTLPNRVMFQERLAQALHRGKTTGIKVAVLCVDLDLFKNVNDSFGHGVGDSLLKLVADRLNSSIRTSDLVARLGGDEFAFILETHSSPKDIGDRAAVLIEALSAPYEIDGREIVVGASIGIAISPGDGEDGEVLLRNADMALYRAKSEGGSSHHFFEKEMDRNAQKRRDMEIDLRAALASGQFELHYQPLVDLSEDRIVAFESLLRWNHPSKGMISPADFIPIAEEIGLITALGEWVLREACAQAVKWPKDIKVAVNLSPVQFRSRNLVSAVISALAQSGLSPFRLELEITESLFLADTEANLAILHQLRALGVRISMDDFGTGYSSLSYLRSFPFDKIKIDRSFVKDLADRPESLAIVRAISGLGRSLNISTTAEGVETKDQLDRLRAEGCTEVQGYFFSAARPATDVQELLLKFGRKASMAA